MKVNELTKAYLQMYRDRKAQGLPPIYRRDLMPIGAEICEEASRTTEQENGQSS